MRSLSKAFGFMVAILFFFSLAGFAKAETFQPWWHLQSGARPSYLPPASEEEGREVPGKGVIVATAANVGNASTSGVVTVKDELPAGVRAIAISGRIPNTRGGGHRLECEIAVVTCRLQGTYKNPQGKAEPKVVLAYTQIEIEISVEVLPEAQVCEPHSSACPLNEVSVSGGGAPPASISRPLTISEKPVPFGVESYEVTPEEEGGQPARQAGEHPFQVTGTLTVNQDASTLNKGEVEAHPVALAKDLGGMLPPGLVGNPTPFPKCTLAQFDKRDCPQQSVIGAAMITADIPNDQNLVTFGASPIVMLEPAHGEPARFGFWASVVPVFLDTHVRSGEDYGITLSSSDISQIAAFITYKLEFWGVPGAPAHDTTRGEGCLFQEREEASEERILEEGFLPCVPLNEKTPPPFLALPTSCSAPLFTSTEADSWLEPRPEGRRQVFPETAPMPALTGCNRLPFEPSIVVTPDGEAASSPTGLNVDVHVPQESILNGSSLAQSNVRNITVTLPQGVALNPAGAGGLEACSEGLIGYEGETEPATSPGLKLPGFTPYLPESTAAEEAVTAHTAPASEDTLSPGVNFCSTASKIGTVTIKTPLLPPNQPLTGSVYLASQESNPFGSLLAMYIVAEDKESGSLVKLPGSVSLSPSGQITATFENNPQLAFEDAELHFFGGERAPLASPTRCGAYTTTASFEPWSAEAWDEAAQTAGASSTFNIKSGPHGTPCPGATLPFNPTVTGGATNIQAGAFSPLTVTVNRKDGEQNLKSLEAKLPPGLSGVLSGVELCPEPQANEGLCGEGSKVGEATIGVGMGSDPFTVTGGKFYLTGPYNGHGSCTVGEVGCAPFGLTFQVPAKAGPFDLANTKNNHPRCDCVLVRGKIELNPQTAAITITSNPPGSPDSIPTSIEGIPLEIQHVNATTTRGNFQFNPTNCSKMSLTGTVQLNEGGTSTISTPFQVTNCAALKFEPKFSVSTSAKTSRTGGASLTAKLAYPNVPQGTDADIAKVKVELPKQLPSRLTTLQKACTAAQFEANPAACPTASKIGYAVVHTPLIPVPLQGPAIFVSHGGEAFPSLTLVLQGYGITIDLVGTTDIKNGVTSTTFKTVPDQPFSSFELTLPEGPYSALTAPGNLCTAKNLTMPTEFLAQNGAELKQNTKIAVTGCPKHKKATHEKKKHKAKIKTKHKRKIKR
jgi:hypothetical protein